MSRNLIICCDGTNNQFGSENTSVVRLVQVLNGDPAQQRLYYDPGVGTLPEPNAFSRVQKKISELLGLAFGVGLTWKVGEAYTYLMDCWEPGDRVFLFGFSRGAYAVRVLAGLLHEIGLLPRGNENLVPYILRLYAAIRQTDAAEANRDSNYWRLCSEFRWTFARAVSRDDDERRFPVYYLGVWDTVSSVGWVWDPKKFPYTARNPSIQIVRHAVSLDERRWFFRQNLMEPADGQDFQQQWFPGVHSDAGGGYAEQDGGLWRVPFLWILDEARKGGLLVDDQRLKIVLDRTPVSPRPWNDPKHESLTWKWWPAEFFPKCVWRPGTGQRSPDVGLGRSRFVRPGDILHKSTLLRIREAPGYVPPNLSESFRQRVKDLPDVPDSLAYEP
jgi:uncharacterized protein (DUF2235 family)